MASSRIFQLVVYFQGLIRDKTGAQVDFINGPNRGRSFKAAQNLLVFTDGDLEKAQGLIDIWAEDAWEIEHNPDNLMRVYQCANKLLVEWQKRQIRQRTVRSDRTRDLSLYRL